MTATPSPRLTVWHDGACPLCEMEIGLLKRLDAKAGRIRFVDLRGDGSCPLDREAMLARFHAQGSAPGAPIVSGARAFALMWREVTPFQPLGWLAGLPGAHRLIDPLYELFLRVRPRLARLVAARDARRRA